MSKDSKLTARYKDFVMNLVSSERVINRAITAIVLIALIFGLPDILRAIAELR